MLPALESGRPDVQELMACRAGQNLQTSSNTLAYMRLNVAIALVKNACLRPALATVSLAERRQLFPCFEIDAW